MSQTDPSCSLPSAQPDQAFMDVSALESGHLTVPKGTVIAGAGFFEPMTCPCLSFHLKHSKQGKRIIFDLGLRKDYDAYPPAILELVKESRDRPSIRIMPEQTVDESLVKGGISPDQIDAVIVSHLHFDHLGDPSLFPKSTIVVGEECKILLDAGYPTDPASFVAKDAIPAERTRFLAQSDFSTSIGPFPRALDYFGDGSLYVIDAPGHLPGHINVLARSSSDGAWIYLAGDAAHSFGIVTGQEKVAYFDNGAGGVQCVHKNAKVAEESVERIRKLLDNSRVQVLVAHDVEWYNENKGGGAFFPGRIPPLA